MRRRSFPRPLPPCPPPHAGEDQVGVEGHFLSPPPRRYHPSPSGGSGTGPSLSLRERCPECRPQKTSPCERKRPAPARRGNVRGYAVLYRSHRHTFSSRWSRSQELITPWKASSSASLMAAKAV